MAISHGSGAEGQPHPGPSFAVIIEVADPELTFIRVDHQARLQFGESEIVIESPFQLAAAGTVHALDPQDRSGLGPLLAVYPDRLNAAGAQADGTLRLTFISGAAVTVAPDPQFEAWQVNKATSHHLLVCMPGGELAVWT